MKMMCVDTDNSIAMSGDSTDDNQSQGLRMQFPKMPSLIGPNDEWVYTMRRTMQEIIPGLYLGPYSSAMKSKLDVLTHHGITHIICVRQSIEAHFIRPNFPDKFKYLVLDIADSVVENIICHFARVRQFIDDSLATGGKTLIHGNAGISRSAALTIAYVMEKYGLNKHDAFYRVQGRRFCINPNEGFLAQLSEYEPIYKAQRTLHNGEGSTVNGLNKRSCDQMDDIPYETISMGYSSQYHHVRGEGMDVSGC